MWYRVYRNPAQVGINRHVFHAGGQNVNGNTIRDMDSLAVAAQGGGARPNTHSSVENVPPSTTSEANKRPQVVRFINRPNMYPPVDRPPPTEPLPLKYPTCREFQEASTKDRLGWQQEYYECFPPPQKGPPDIDRLAQTIMVGRQSCALHNMHPSPFPFRARVGQQKPVSMRTSKIVAEEASNDILPPRGDSQM